MNKCPYFGSKIGVYATFTGVQYYSWDGEAQGYSTDIPENQKTYTRCLKCNRRISMRWIIKDAQKNEGINRAT